VKELFDQKVIDEFTGVLDKDLQDIRDVLRAVSLMRYKGEKIVELVSG